MQLVVKGGIVAVTMRPADSAPPQIMGANANFRYETKVDLFKELSKYVWTIVKGEEDKVKYDLTFLYLFEK